VNEDYAIAVQDRLCGAGLHPMAHPHDTPERMVVDVIWSTIAIGINPGHGELAAHRLAELLRAVGRGDLATIAERIEAEIIATPVPRGVG
jgi:hypothetical protein